MKKAERHDFNSELRKEISSGWCNYKCRTKWLLSSNCFRSNSPMHTSARKRITLVIMFVVERRMWLKVTEDREGVYMKKRDISSLLPAVISDESCATFYCIHVVKELFLLWLLPMAKSYSWLAVWKNLKLCSKIIPSRMSETSKNFEARFIRGSFSRGFRIYYLWYSK